jgi:hypothetical protein
VSHQSEITMTLRDDENSSDPHYNTPIITTMAMALHQHPSTGHKYRASVLLFACIFVSLGSECLALVSPARKLLPKAPVANPNSTPIHKVSWKSLLQPILPLLLTGLIALPANAAVDGRVYTNDYADPFHPLCKRHIQVVGDGKSFRYWGTAVGPKNDPIERGCSPEEIREFGLRQGKFKGVITDENKISAGDGIHEGVWEPASSATTNLGYEDVDGIRWNDGNKWVVKETKKTPKLAGQVIFYSYIGFSTLAGGKGLYDGIQRKREASK